MSGFFVKHTTKEKQRRDSKNKVTKTCIRKIFLKETSKQENSEEIFPFLYKSYTELKKQKEKRTKKMWERNKNKFGFKSRFGRGKKMKNKVTRHIHSKKSENREKYEKKEENKKMMENMWKTVKKCGKERGKEEISSEDFFSPKRFFFFFKKVDTQRNDKSRYKKGFQKNIEKEVKKLKICKKNTERQ